MAWLDEQITAENFVKVRTARVESIKELLKNPSYVAEKAAAKRLLGDYPYGRPQEGTLEDLAKIDRFDLVAAKERFLTADNATLTITGNVEFKRALKASKQLFGGWKKADKLVPATFASPNEVDVKPLKIEIDSNDVYFAMRGIARSDKMFFASQILTNALQTHNSKRCSFSQKINILPSLIRVRTPKMLWPPLICQE